MSFGDKFDLTRAVRVEVVRYTMGPDGTVEDAEIRVHERDGSAWKKPTGPLGFNPESLAKFIHLLNWELGKLHDR